MRVVDAPRAFRQKLMHQLRSATPRPRAVEVKSPAMGFSRLVLLVVVIATAVVSLAALIQHLFLGGTSPFRGEILIGLACGIAFAVYLKRSEQSDSHN